MKTLINISISNRVIIYTFIIYLLLGCSDDKKKIDPLSQLQKRLRGTWTVSKVTLNGLDVTVFYAGFTVDFNADYTFECENEVDPVWPISGTYENSIENDQRIIMRDDGVRLTVLTLSSSELIIQFPWAGASGGKQMDLNGEYEFTFTK